jgi:hypothetical protein
MEQNPIYHFECQNRSLAIRNELKSIFNERKRKDASSFNFSI